MVKVIRYFLSVVFFLLTIQVSSQSIQIDNSNLITNGVYCNGSSIAVPIKISGCFNETNVFQLYLSEPGGSFANETLIGTFNSYFTTFINGTIPFSSGFGYKVRVKSTSPAITSAVSTTAFDIGFASYLITARVNPQHPSRILEDQKYFGWCSGSIDNNQMVLLNESSHGSQITSTLINEKTGVVTRPPTVNNTVPLTLARNYYTYIVRNEYDGVLNTKAYNIINSPNRLALSTDGSQIGCLPDTLGFAFAIDPVQGGIGDNFPLQKYTIDWGDSTPITTLRLCDIIANNGIIKHFYFESSCSVKNQAFDVLIQMQNNFYVRDGSPTQQNCEQPFISTRARVFKKPLAEFTFENPSCSETEILFKNKSVNGNTPLGPTCVSNAYHTWYVDNVMVQQSAFVGYAPDLKYTFPGPGKYAIRLFVDNGTCGSATFYDTICILPKPTPVFTFNGENATSCLPYSVTTNNTTASSDCDPTKYLWSVVDSLTGIPVPSDYYTVTPSLTAANPVFNFIRGGVFKIRLRASNKCSGIYESEKTIRLIEKPKVILPPNTTYCGLKELNFSIDDKHKPVYNTMGNYSWVITGGSYTYINGTNSLSQYPQIKFNDLLPYLIKVKFTNACGEDSTTQTIRFDTAANINASPDITVCPSTNSVQLTGSVSGAFNSYSWNIVFGSGNIDQPTTLNPTYYISSQDKVNGIVKLALTAYSTSNSGCASTSEEVVITINSGNAITSPALKTICSGQNVNYTPTALTNSSFTWRSTILSGSITGVSSSGSGNITDVLINQSAIETGVVRYTITAAKDGCVGIPFNFDVTVRPASKLTVTAPTTTCAGNEINIILNSTVPGSLYTWTSTANGNVVGNTNQTVPGTNNIINNLLTTTSTTNITLIYRITVFDAITGCEGETKQIAVTLVPIPSLPDAGPDQILCAQSTTTLNARQPLIGSGQWLQISGFPATMSNVNSVNPTLSGLLPNNTYGFAWVVGNNCSSNADTVFVINRPSVSRSNAGNDVVICDFVNEDTVRLNGNKDVQRSYETGVWTLISQPGGGNGRIVNNIDPQSNFIFSKSGVYKLKWELNNEICSPTTDTIEIRVYDKTVGGILTPAISNICEGQSVAFNLSSYVGKIAKWQYKNSNVWKDTVITENNFILSNIRLKTELRVIVISEGGSDNCNASDTSNTVVVDVIPMPFGGNLSPSDTVCQTSNMGLLTLTNNVGTVVKWQQSTDAGITWSDINITSQTYVYNNLNTTSLFRVLLSSGTCFTAYSDTVKIVVIPPVTVANAGSDRTLCLQDTIRLNGNQPLVGTGLWKQILGPSTSVITGNIASNLQPGTYSFVYTITNGICSDSRDTVFINFSTPTVSGETIGSDTACAASNNGTIILRGQTGNVVRWEMSTDGLSWSNIANTTTNQTYTNLTTTTYYRALVQSGVCAAIYSNVSIITIYQPVTIANAGADRVVCVQDTIKLAANNPTSGNGRWSQLSGPSDVTFANIINPSTTISNLVSGSYSFVWLIRNGVCADSRDTINVRLIPLTVAGVLSGEDTVCTFNNSGVINLSGNVGDVLYWQFSTDNGISWNGINNTTNTQNYSNLRVTTLYRAVVKNDLCDISFTEPTRITVRPFVTVAKAGPDQLLCNSSNTILKADNPNEFETGRWTTTSSAILGSQTSATTTVSGLSVGTYSFTWTLSNGVCPVTKDSVVITIVPALTNVIDTATISICKGEIIGVNGSPATGGNGTYIYQWQSSTDGINWSNITGENGLNLSITPSISGYVRRMVSSLPCETFSLPVRLFVAQPISQNGITANQSICIGTTPNVLVGTPTFGGGSTPTYQWFSSNDGIFWNLIPNAISKDYQPGNITVSTFYKRVVNTILCSGSYSSTSNVVKITINYDAIADFNFTDQTGCAPWVLNNNVITTNQHADRNLAYNWFVDNSFIGSGVNFPGFTITKPADTVMVSLITTSIYACKSDTSSQQFITAYKPIPAFTQSDTASCSTLAVTFKNETPDIDQFTYKWDFGNGNISYLPQPASITFQPHPSTRDTIYSIRLTAYGLCDTISTVHTVRIKSKPIALFTPTKVLGCSPMTVKFGNDSRGSNNEFKWDFGDGQTMTTYNRDSVTHTYFTGVQKVFVITMTASNTCGADTQRINITVTPNDIDLNVLINGNELEGCAPHTVNFVSNSAGATSYQWTFGDGNTYNTSNGTGIVTHKYNQPGVYTVTIHGISSCTDTTITRTIKVLGNPVANFNNVSSVCIGDSVLFINNSDQSSTSYAWSFGDGVTSTLTNPVHTYKTARNYSIQLVAYKLYPSGISCNDTATGSIKIVDSLPGTFNITDTVGKCLPFSVVVSTSYPSTSTTTWDFGDGTKSTGSSATHIYTKSGLYVIKMVSVELGGCVYSSSKTIRVTGPSGTFNYDKGINCNNVPVRFEATVNNVDSIRWFFGDGTSTVTTNSIIYHVYNSAGIYLPSVELMYGNCKVIINGADTIKTDYVKAGFRTTVNKVCGSTTVSFIDTSATFTGVKSTIWNFGDGTTSTTRNPTHEYKTTNTYMVRLITFSNSGCTDTITRNISVSVNENPVAGIIGDSISCVNKPITFNSSISSTSPIVSYQWSFSNGYSASTVLTNATFGIAGTQQAVLTVTTTDGCKDTVEKNFEIYALPIIRLGADVTLCPGQTYQIQATGGVSYAWSPSIWLSCLSCSNPVANPLSTTSYTVVGTSAQGCSSKDTVTVKIATPTQLSISGDDTLCVGERSQLLISGAAVVNWTPAVGLNKADIPDPIATPLITTTYRVIGTDELSCFSDTLYKTIYVGQKPTIQLGGDKMVATGTQIPLISLVSNGPITQWQWSPATNLNCTTCRIPTATARTNISYVVKGTTAFGCSATDTIKITTFCEGAQLFIPNVFTPDGDGINDKLTLQASGIALIKLFRIYNRWGEIVFERSNFQPNNAIYGWDGSLQSNNKAPSDVYVYVCEAVCDNGTTYSYKGNVSIIR